jgi:hypothetical protein
MGRGYNSRQSSEAILEINFLRTLETDLQSFFNQTGTRQFKYPRVQRRGPLYDYGGDDISGRHIQFSFFSSRNSV